MRGGETIAVELAFQIRGKIASFVSVSGDCEGGAKFCGHQQIFDDERQFIVPFRHVSSRSVR
jgi:hypothetical protein